MARYGDKRVWKNLSHIHYLLKPRPKWPRYQRKSTWVASLLNSRISQECGSSSYLLIQCVLGVIIESRWLSRSQKWGSSRYPCCPVSYGPSLVADTLSHTERLPYPLHMRWSHSRHWLFSLCTYSLWYLIEPLLRSGFYTEPFSFLNHI
jgi:hypothetical protein